MHERNVIIPSETLQSQNNYGTIVVPSVSAVSPVAISIASSEVMKGGNTLTSAVSLISNADGKINSKDLVRIMKYLAGDTGVVLLIP